MKKTLTALLLAGSFAALPASANARQFHRETFHLYPGVHRLILARGVTNLDLTSVRVNGRHMKLGDVQSSTCIDMYGFGIAARFDSPGSTVYATLASTNTRRLRITVRFFSSR